MARRLSHAAILLSVLLSIALVALGCRRSRDKTAHVPAPTGGAAAELDVGDAGDAILEGGHRYAVLMWSFPLERYEVTIEDAGMSPAIEGVLQRTNAELAVNGGFFDKDGKALGLAISNGAKLAPFARGLSGGVLTIGDGRARLQATESFTEDDGTRFALQCRPRLVVEGTPNVRSDDGKRSERTALCIKDGGRALDLLLVRGDGDERGPSLFALGRWLAARGCEGALNLDGGPSTGVAWRDGADVKTLPPRGPIRHAIVFKKR